MDISYRPLFLWMSSEKVLVILTYMGIDETMLNAYGTLRGARLNEGI